jgi:hypothetical protein
MKAWVFTRSGFLIAVSEGEVESGVIAWGGTAATTGNFEWTQPQFGRWPEWTEDQSEIALAIPLWLPLGLLAAWVAFREWRRKRRTA